MRQVQSLKESKRREKIKTIIKNTICYFFLSLGGLTMIIPFLWMVSTSIKEPGEVFTYPPVWIPTKEAVLIDGKWYKGERTGEKIEHGLYRIEFLSGSRRGEQIEVSTERIKRGLFKTYVKGELGDRRKYRVKIVEVIKPIKYKIKIIQKGPYEGQVKWFEETKVRKVFAPVWENYIKAWHAVPFGRFYLNSIFVAVCVTAGQVFTSSLAAYAFARLKFPGRDKLFLAYLATMMIPGAVTMIPVFILLKLMGWIDTYRALIIPCMFTAYGTFMLRQFFMTLPTELEDAAKIDGCSLFGIYFRIILPLSKPALATLTTFTFMGSWGSFMWPLIVINSMEKKTLPIGLAAFQGLYTTDWTLLMAGSVMVMLPVIIVFVFNQRFFVEGIKLSGMGGM